MKKFTKTQIELLKKATESRFGYCYTTLVSGRGADGGLARYRGHRESDAACKLRDAGLLVFVKHEHAVEARNGFQKHFTTGIWTITEAGRAAAAAL